MESGTYAVVISVGRGWQIYHGYTLGSLLVKELHLRQGVASETVKRMQHVGPETIASGISLDAAIRLKDAITKAFPTGFGGPAVKVKIKEGVRPGAGKRKPIPERVRGEVWRRDGGKCVDCGSRERLEYDHIVPVSQGGSNTARNIEIRCEACNRSKAARI